MSKVIIVNAIQTLWSQGTQPSNYLRFHETTSVSFRFKEQATNSNVVYGVAGAVKMQ